MKIQKITQQAEKKLIELLEKKKDKKKRERSKKYKITGTTPKTSSAIAELSNKNINNKLG